MRWIVWCAGLAVAGTLAVASVEGCSSSTPSTPADDGGGLLADRVPTDSPAADTGDASACIDADLHHPNLQDAALDDAGATIGTCYACTTDHCDSELTACNDNCECREATFEFFDCVRQGNAPSGCFLDKFGSLSASASKVADPLGTCVYGNCKAACAIPDVDGGARGSSDASKDAPHEGG